MSWILYPFPYYHPVVRQLNGTHGEYTNTDDHDAIDHANKVRRNKEAKNRKLHQRNPEVGRHGGEKVPLVQPVEPLFDDSEARHELVYEPGNNREYKLFHHSVVNNLGLFSWFSWLSNVICSNQLFCPQPEANSYVDSDMSLDDQMRWRRDRNSYELPRLQSGIHNLSIQVDPNTTHNSYRIVVLSSDFVNYCDGRINCSTASLNSLHDFVCMFVNDVKMPGHMRKWWEALSPLEREDYKQCIYQRVYTRLTRVKNYANVASLRSV